MKIAVCIKQVPVLSAMRFDAETRTLQREGVRSEVSSFDVRALLKALELRNTQGGEVVAVTMGPPQAREALQYCLALGADRALHLCDRAFAGADTLATAHALAACLARENFDLVLCGRYSTDAETAQIGPELAELLDFPQITGARALEIDRAASLITAERETDEGFETVTAPLPALVTAAEGLAAERFPSKAERAAAEGKKIEQVDAKALGTDVNRFGSAGSPTSVAGLLAVQEDRQAVILEGATPEEAVDRLMVHLREAGVFRRGEGAPLRPAEDLPRVVRKGPCDILVVAEELHGKVRPVTLELVTRARELAGRIGGSVLVVALRDAQSILDAVGRHGADRIIVPNGVLQSSEIERSTAFLVRIIEEWRPGIVLVPSTGFGRDLAPRVAARLNLGLTGDCIDLSLDVEGRLVQHKPAFGGQIVAPIFSRTFPEMATVRPGMLTARPVEDIRRPEIVRVELPHVIERMRVIERRQLSDDATGLDQAEIVLGIGKGIGGPENIAVVRELAARVGAPLCTTRDVADLGWLPRQYQVGLTGRAIAPRLYIAVGIRGAFEHTVGVRRAGIIVAINKSAKAPIFKSADYGLMYEWQSCLPHLVEKLCHLAAEAKTGLTDSRLG